MIALSTYLRQYKYADRWITAELGVSELTNTPGLETLSMLLQTVPFRRGQSNQFQFSTTKAPTWSRKTIRTTESYTHTHKHTHTHKNKGADTTPNNSMPYKVYHGKTGVIYNVTKSAVGVILYRRVGNRYIEKRVNLRVEHVKLSRSRDDFLRRVKENAAKRKVVKEGGESVSLKRMPVPPREARTVDVKTNKPESITPIPYDTHI